MSEAYAKAVFRQQTSTFVNVTPFPPSFSPHGVERYINLPLSSGTWQEQCFDIKKLPAFACAILMRRWTRCAFAQRAGAIIVVPYVASLPRVGVL